MTVQKDPMPSNTTIYLPTVTGPMSIEAIEAHALNALAINPGSIEANDKMLLVREIKRLREKIDLIQRTWDAYPVRMMQKVLNDE